jgi:hypothetical protein
MISGETHPQRSSVMVGLKSFPTQLFIAYIRLYDKEDKFDNFQYFRDGDYG